MYTGDGPHPNIDSRKYGIHNGFNLSSGFTKIWFTPEKPTQGNIKMQGKEKLQVYVFVKIVMCDVLQIHKKMTEAKDYEMQSRLFYKILFFIKEKNKYEIKFRLVPI